MARADKAESVAEITEHLRSASATVLTEYRGLTVAQLKELRRSLGEGAHYAVVKNTLTRIAAKDAGVTGLDDLLTGPSALAFIKGDPVQAAKGLRDFAKANPLLVIKGGYMDGKLLSPAEVGKIADLESREVLLAKLAGAMKAKTSQAAALFQAPLSKVARTVEALRVKAEADPSVIGGAGAPPAAEEVETAGTTDTTVTDGETSAEETAPAVTDAPEAPTSEAPADETTTEATAAEESTEG